MLRIETDEKFLCSREERLFVSLYLFVCHFVSLAPISWISFWAYIGDLRENLLGKTNLAKIVPKLSRSLLEDLSMLQYIQRHYMAINALPSEEDLSDS